MNLHQVSLPTPGNRKVLLLHGAGVAARLTWGGVIPQLRQVSEVLAPDLYGAGETFYAHRSEQAFSIDEQVAHLAQVLTDYGWHEFDLVGYSFGGLLAMKLAATGEFSIARTVLVEPALMEREDWQETLTRRRLYRHATEPLKTSATPEQGVTAFLDLVSPGRSKHPRVERRVVSRLAHRPVGLAHALESVAEAAEGLDRERLLAHQRHVLSVVGERTPEPAHELHRRLASRPDWTYRTVPGCDHALPYQKPAMLGDLISAFIGTDA